MQVVMHVGLITIVRFKVTNLSFSVTLPKLVIGRYPEPNHPYAFLAIYP